MGGSWSLGRIWLKFPPEHPMHGFEALMRRRLMREPDADEFQWLTDEQVNALAIEDKRAYLAALAEYRCREFARYLIKWNFAEKIYDDEGEEIGEERVPPTAEGVGRLDAETFSALWIAYNEATIVVAPPLPQRSAAGEPSAAESTLPQEPLSSSPRTLDTL